MQQKQIGTYQKSDLEAGCTSMELSLHLTGNSRSSDERDQSQAFERLAKRQGLQIRRFESKLNGPFDACTRGYFGH